MGPETIFAILTALKIGTGIIEAVGKIEGLDIHEKLTDEQKAAIRFDKDNAVDRFEQA